MLGMSSHHTARLAPHTHHIIVVYINLSIDIKNTRHGRVHAGRDLLCTGAII